ncbi:antirestriction protein [Erwinia typographi]|uniref:Antirestriction protein n=1 Tax=Erwinia typographi TaxID=371042 RepID=A0A0A3YJN5_9GAMM|nr:antirestriction protein [Erwinia typographi]KGT86865.1 antirestriction protein [Erwinia typographi]
MQTTTVRPDAFEVSPAERPCFLPRLFSTDYLRAEISAYVYAGKYLTDYSGGEWAFMRLAGTGGYMVPPAGTWCFENPDNGAVAVVSADAAGIIITALVLNHRSHLYARHDQEALCAHFTLRWRQLMDFAETHPEAAAIFRALD